MIRRAALRALAGAAAGAALFRRSAATQAQQFQLSASPGSIGAPVGGLAQVAQASPRSHSPKAWRQFWDLMDPHQRRQEFRALEASFTGGMPPGIACCNSWSPAFKARVAARTLMRARIQDRAFEDRLRESIFGVEE